MATATDIYQEVLFSDGEGATPDDINESQRRLRGMILDTLLAFRITNGIQDGSGGIGAVLDPELGDWLVYGDLAAAAAQVAFTPFPQTGFTNNDLAARTLVVQPGVFVQSLQDIASSTPDLPTCLLFTLNAPVSLVTAVGDATNPRVDLVEMKLEIVEDSPDARDFEDAVTRAKSSTNPNKARRTKATFQIKAGTPAASPAYPSCTAGFVPVSAVWVPATHNAVHSGANMRDLRWPLGGVRVYDVDITAFNINAGGTAWTLDGANWRADADAAASGFMYAPCPIGGHCSRLLAVGVMGEFPGAGEVKLRRMTLGAAGAAYQTLADLQVEIHDFLNTGPAFAWGTAIHFMDLAPSDYPNEGARAPNSNIGFPVWVNGNPLGPGVHAGVVDVADTTVAKLVMEFQGETPDSGTYIQLVRFVVAHGM